MTRQDFVEEWMKELTTICWRGYTTKEVNRGELMSSMEYDCRVLRSRLGDLYDRIQEAIRTHAAPPLPRDPKLATLEEMVRAIYEAFIDNLKRKQTKPPEGNNQILPLNKRTS